MEVTSSNKWKLFFDGSCSRTIGSGAGIVLEDPIGKKECYFKDLGFNLTCNELEYAALIAGLEKVRGKQIMSLEVLGDSKLICKQVAGDWEVKYERLYPYHQVAISLAKQFAKLEIKHIPRIMNQQADSLSKLLHKDSA
jgi:ribonuclease HI